MTDRDRTFIVCFFTLVLLGQVGPCIMLERLDQKLDAVVREIEGNDTSKR